MLCWLFEMQIDNEYEILFVFNNTIIREYYNKWDMN